KVEVGLTTVIGHEDFTVLERIHRAWVNVDVWIELLEGDSQTSQLQQPTKGRRGEALAERAGNASCHKNVFGHFRPPSDNNTTVNHHTALRGTLVPSRVEISRQ
ncbi:MAG: hypothetical protein ACI9CV_001988, partial [Ilumatobacter sp.]